MDLVNAIKISASGMRAQGTRLRVVAENVANAESVGNNPGDSPYRRKTITFDNVLDRNLNADLVKVAKIGRDTSDFNTVYEPHHPLADDNGYVKMPNVNSLVELTDMREAERSYEANLSVIESSKSLIQRTIDLLRA
ncbi:flagellar basal-body rod protein FlgC [Thalassobaculum fulvum]|jgi:flagellar basal-body rod protein FlgC|uniref:Flagellar basal-body rod protein FlgC n=1 Tax=Thalassobaculum fulvum TaxID=1633335 RepID=A0A918XXV3_9PROT|nr:flagellar basal body rod protein FlgC [Thalassobaculum fulvum]GHD61022.1 flagellar basal-body rod protein FlgC [Thalassobaculum fulvum]